MVQRVQQAVQVQLVAQDQRVLWVLLVRKVLQELQVLQVVQVAVDQQVRKVQQDQ